MKILQANIWSGRLIRSFIKLLQQEMPDILILQEVVSSPEGKSSYFDALEMIKAITGFEHVFFTPAWSSVLMNKPVHYGQAILSRHPLTDTYVEFTNLAYHPDIDFGKNDRNIRFFQHAVVHTPEDKEINLINHHGFHDYGSKDGNEKTEQACQRIADYVATLDGPKIITGDFNLVPHAASLKPLNDAYENLCITHKVETTRNEFARSMFPVDFIWISNDIAAKNFTVCPELVSDHAALIVEIT